MVGVVDAETRSLRSPYATQPERSEEKTTFDPGDALGRYVLEEQLGQGGMGAVYRAHDPKLGRDVAIKVLRHRLSGQDKHRLLEEARALAVLSHPNVVPVFDVGLQGKTLYVAMELVEGETLRTWVRTAAPSRRERLDALLAAGRGLAAAHESGIVHRDVKPANVLMGEDGRVRVADFGLAIGADPTERSQSQTGSRSRDSSQGEYVEGTPRYMAPEQHAGAVPEPTADQYSFCLMAVELLTGDKPFKGIRGRALVSAKHRLPDAHPPEGIPRKSWTVLRRGLDPVPENRWASMHALLVALERATRPPRLWPLVIPVAAVSGWLATRGDEAVPVVAGPCSEAEPRPWTADQYTSAREGLHASGHDGAAEAWTKVDVRLTEFSTLWTAGMREACEAAADPTQDTRIICLERAGGRASAFVEVLAKTRNSEVDAAVHNVWSATQLETCTEAESAAGKSDAAWTMVTQALALQYLGRTEDADAMLTGVLEQLGTERTWSGVQARRTRGMFRLNDGHIELARTDLEQAYHDAAAAGLDDISFGAAASLSSLESEHRGDAQAAEEWLRHAEAAVQRGNLQGADYEADLLNAKAGIALAAGRFADAVAPLQREVALRRTLDAPPHLAGALQELATVLALAGRIDDAIETLREGLAIWKDIGLDETIDGASTRANLASTLAEAGRYQEAIAEHDRSIAIYENIPNRPVRSFGLAYVNRGIALTYAGRHEEAIDSLRRGYTVLEELLGADNPDTVRSRLNLGLALLGGGHLEEARKEYIAVHEWSRAALGEEHPMTAASLANVAEVLLRQGELEESARLSREALAALDQTVGREHSYSATTLANLGEAELKLGNREAGLAKIDEALRIHQAASEDPRLAQDVAERVLELLGDEPGPQDLRSRCRALVDEH